MMKIFTILSVVFLLFTLGLAQEEELQTNRNREIYETAFREAFNDGKISSEEKAMLKTLGNSLGLTAEDIKVIEKRVKEVQLSQEAKKLDQSGRWITFAQNIGYAVGLYGWGIPYVLNAEDIKWYVGGEMIAVPLAFVLTERRTKNVEFPYSRAFFRLYGNVIAMNLWTVTDKLRKGGEKENMINRMCTIPLGILIMEHFYRVYKPSLGQSIAKITWANMSSSGLYNLYKLLDRPPKEPEMEFEYENPVESEEYDKRLRRWKSKAMLFSIAGHPLGFWLEHKYMGQKDYSLGDAVLLNGGWSLGVFYFVMTDLLLYNGEKNPFRVDAIPLRLAYSWAGVLLAHRFLEGKDYSFGQSVILMLGSYAGGAFMFGMDVLLEVQNERTVAFSGMAGVAAGLYFTNKMIKPFKDGILTEKNKNISVTPSFSFNGNSLDPSLTINWNF